MAKKKSLFKHVNPEILAWSGKHDLPRFDRIANTDFAPAFEAAMKSGLGEIDAIAGQNKKPGFKNTIVALERAEDALNRVSALFWNRAGADTDETIQALEREITPKLSRYSSQIAMNAKLFRRIDALWQKRKKLKLGTEEERVLERYWKGYVRSGARLPKAQQKELAEINEKLASLGTQFGQNLLADEAGWQMEVDGEALENLPGFLKQAMAAAAAERGLEGKHVVTLARSIIEPFLTFCENRDLREKAFKA